jgi:large subunit ribosomal protein L4
MEAVLYTKEGKENGTISLKDELFGREVQMGLIHRLLRLQRSNARIAIAHTKSRADVIGSTRKLYKQKGTGSARVGDARSPVRRGGGVAFGPQNDRNFTIRMNKKERRAALFSLLSAKAGENGIKIVESFGEDAMKTKKMIDLVTKMDVTSGVFAICPEDTAAFVGGRNIPTVKFIGVNYLNPMDLLKYNNLVFTKASIEKLYSLYL